METKNKKWNLPYLITIKLFCCFDFYDSYPKHLQIGGNSAGIPQGSVLGTLLLNISCNVKFFVDMSLLTTFQDLDTVASELNHDLEMIRQ